MYFGDWQKIFNDNPDHGDALLKEYAEQLVKNGITQKLLIKGLDRASEETFRPNPFKFALLCMPRPEDFGIPVFDDAYREITQEAPKSRRYGKPHTFSHRVIEIVYERVGSRQYTHGMKDETFRNIVKTEFDYWVYQAVRDLLPEKKKQISYVTAAEPPINQFLKLNNREQVKAGDVNNFFDLRKLLNLRVG
jgi:hypothetical protein